MAPNYFKARALKLAKTVITDATINVITIIVIIDNHLGKLTIETIGYALKSLLTSLQQMRPVPKDLLAGRVAADQSCLLS